MVNHFIPTPINGSGYTRTNDGKSPVGDGFPVELLKHVGYEITKTSLDLHSESVKRNPGQNRKQSHW